MGEPLVKAELFIFFVALVQKIRCIKQKIYDQLKLSDAERRQNMTEYWAKRLDEIMRVPIVK